MSKQEQLMEYIVQDVVAYIMEDTGAGLEEAMYRFYSSKTFEKLHDPETGLYLEGSAFIYELYKDEEATATTYNNIAGVYYNQGD